MMTIEEIQAALKAIPTTSENRLVVFDNIFEDTLFFYYRGMEYCFLYKGDELIMKQVWHHGMEYTFKAQLELFQLLSEVIK